MQYIIAVLGIFGIDLGIKEYMERSLGDADEKKCGGAFILRKHHNKGAFLNIGQHRQGLVMALSVFLTIVLTVCYIITLGHAGKHTLKWGLSLLLGGACSNTYDRVARKYVVDYVSFQVPWKGLERIVFNLGDFCIIIGTLICLLGYNGKNNGKFIKSS